MKIIIPADPPARKQADPEQSVESPQEEIADTPAETREAEISRILEELRLMAMEPKLKDNVITLEGLKTFAERLMSVVALSEDIIPTVIDGVDVNGKPAPVKAKRAQVTVPTLVSQLDDAGSYVHIKALMAELEKYVPRNELPGELLSEEEKKNLQNLPDITVKGGPNTVSLGESGFLEVESLTPDRISGEGYCIVLDGGGPTF